MTQTQEDLPSSTRSYDWTEPAGVLPLLATLPGADYVAGVGDGTVPPPPIASTLGFGRISLVDGAVLLEMEPQSFHDNPIGSMHGGVIATMLDTVTGCAVHATLPGRCHLHLAGPLGALHPCRAPRHGDRHRDRTRGPPRVADRGRRGERGGRGGSAARHGDVHLPHHRTVMSGPS